MKSKSWNSIGRWIIYGLLLVVFVGPYWGIIATAFSGAPVKPGELLAWPNQFSWDNFIFAWMDIGVWQYLLIPAELHRRGVLRHRVTGIGQCASRLCAGA